MGPMTVSLMCVHRRIFSPIHVLYHLLIALRQFNQSMKFSQGLFRTSGKRTWSRLVLCMCLGLSSPRNTTSSGSPAGKINILDLKEGMPYFLCHSSVGILWESRSTHNEVLLRWLGCSEEKEGFWWKRNEAVLLRSGVTSKWWCSDSQQTSLCGQRTSALQCHFRIHHHMDWDTHSSRSAFWFWQEDFDKVGWSDNLTVQRRVRGKGTRDTIVAPQAQADYITNYNAVDRNDQDSAD